MKRQIILLSTAAILLGSALSSASVSAATANALISGSGSSWAADAIDQWIADEDSQGVPVVYTAAGSAQGRLDFANRTTDFAVTDLPYQGAEDNSGGRAFAYVPLAGGGLAITYHLEVGGQLLRDLRLSGGTLFKIFTGQIAFWDDPAIAADNNDRLALPHLALQPVVHGEGSATSDLLSGYFDALFPADWSTFAGAAGATPYFPKVDTAVAANGSNAVMNFVSSSAGNGSIGYVENGYAVARNYPVAAIENAAHYYVAPTPNAVAIGLSAAQSSPDPDGATDFRPVFGAADARAYPLSSYDYALVPTAVDDTRMTTAKRQTLVDFLDHALCRGQAEVIAAGYAPLPLPAVATAFDRLRVLHAADSNVDVSSLDTGECANPTFAGDPAHETLTDAPLPPACAAAGHGPCSVLDATALSASGSSVIGYGSSRSIDVTLEDRATGTAVIHGEVRLFEQPAGAASWHLARTLATDASGRSAITVRPAITTRYRWTYAGDDVRRGTTSAVTTVWVRTAVSLHLTRKRLALGERLVAWGTVHPIREGRRVRVEQRVGSRWVVIGSPMVRRQLLPDGRRAVGYRLRVCPHPRGIIRFRTLAPATPTNLASLSPVLRMTVT